MDREEKLASGAVAAIWIGIVLMVIILAIGGYWVDRTFFYPQIRQNTIQNPDRSIANRKYFHDVLRAILAADQNIKSQSAEMETFKADHPKPWSAIAEQQYSDLQNQMSGLQQIRTGDIADYNAASDNPDTGRDRDFWLPAHLDQTESLDTEIQLITTTNHN